MNIARVCVEVAADACLPSIVRLRAGNSVGQPNQAIIEVSIVYQWKTSRCGKCSKVGHSESHCKPTKEFRPTGIIIKTSPVPRGRGKPSNHHTNIERKVVPEPAMSNAIVNYTDPIKSRKNIAETNFETVKPLNNHDIESRTGTQLRRDHCPGISCSNTFEVLQLVGDVSQLPESDPLNGDNKEVEISETFIQPPLDSQPCLLDRDSNAMCSSNGFTPTTCVLEDMQSSFDNMILKEAEHKPFPEARRDPSSMRQGIQPSTLIYSCSNINKLLKGRDPIRVVTKPNEAKQDRTQLAPTSFAEMRTTILNPDACNGPPHNGAQYFRSSKQISITYYPGSNTNIGFRRHSAATGPKNRQCVVGPAGAGPTTCGSPISYNNNHYRGRVNKQQLAAK
ncbi:hypothetical protein Nepgr_007854 [Nepenthes gracilis]|uniref:Uncharacterized protein n=1 Tax=Nepenthes gracilis TaxID=150966 RepID=A0AAD3XIQ4_NEPGR|nr:hypothetical protein Nepgr_007854 [Nepenthes gracilis]